MLAQTASTYAVGCTPIFDIDLSEVEKIMDEIICENFKSNVPGL